MIVEIGGTVGDIEGLPFLEAVRQFKKDVGQGQRDLRPPDARAVHQGRAASSRPRPPSTRSRSCGPSASSPTSLLCRTDQAILPPGDQVEDRALLRRRGGGGHHRQGRGHDLRGAARLPRAGARRDHREAARAAGRPHRPRPLGGDRPPDQGAARRPSASRSWASTSRSRTRTRASTRRWPTAASPTRRAVERGVGRRRAASSATGPTAHVAGVDGILVPGRLRRPRHRGQDRGDPLRARASACRTSASAWACSAR